MRKSSTNHRPVSLQADLTTFKRIVTHSASVTIHTRCRQPGQRQMQLEEFSSIQFLCPTSCRSALTIIVDIDTRALRYVTRSSYTAEGASLASNSLP